MARNATITVIQTTRANLDAQATAGGLLAGEPYLITDENRLAIGTSASTYQAAALEGEGGTGGSSGGSSGAAWGQITGTLSAQTDLASALSAKAALAGATFSGPVSTVPATASAAGINIGSGTFVSSANPGDIWITSAGFFYAYGSSTYQAASLSGNTFGYKNTFSGANVSNPAICLTPGSVPTTLVNGDVWTTSTTLGIRLNGVSQTVAFLASPTFTGTPAAPTAAAGTNTTQLATTAFVTAAAALKANLASPTLTGTPAAPTPAAGTNTTQIATTAFVVASYAPLASPTLTGTPAAPTAAAGTNTTQLATTAFVTTALPPKGFSIFCSGRPNASEIVAGVISPYAYTITAANCSFKANTAATASTVLTITKNGTSIGTATFAAGGTTATVAITTTAVAVGDFLTVVAPSAQDNTLADFAGVVRA